MTENTASTPNRRAVLRSLGVVALATAASCTPRPAPGGTKSARPVSSSGGSGSGGPAAGSEGPTRPGSQPGSTAQKRGADPAATAVDQGEATTTPEDHARPPVKRGTLLGAGSHSDAGKRRHYLTILNLDAPAPHPQPIATRFFGHGVAVDPSDASRVILFEKHGPGCCEIDLNTRKALRTIPTVAERQFYGHGVFTSDGALLLAVETVVGDGSKRGVIVVRDGRTLVAKGLFPSYGEAPHDCQLIDGGRTLVVTNGGGTLASGHPPNVAYIDVATRKLKERILFADPRINAGHLAISRGGDLVVVSAPRDGLDLNAAGVHGAISFRSHGSREPLTTPASDVIGHMRAETLSVAIHEATGVVGVTNPVGNLVTFWDLKTGKLMSSLNTFKQPRGIAVALDGSCFVLTWGGTASLALIDPHTLRPMPGGVSRAWISGSHVYVHRLVGS